jgi:hypothetical protein
VPPLPRLVVSSGNLFQVREKAMTSLATAVGGMKHWDWCPICRGGLDTGLECDQCGADLMPIYTALKESLSGGNPGEPKACTPAEERGIVGATGAGQPPDGNPESTGDSAERRSPDGTELTPSPDESHRHPSSKSTVWMAKNRAYSETCYFGNYATAVAWARGGTVVPVEIQHYTSPALRVPRTDMLAEAVRMIQGYKRAGWLTNPAAGEQAIDFIARASHEPEGWRTGVHEDSSQVWLTLRGPEGQQAAFAVPNVGIRAEILRGYRAALTKEKAL